jgi:hypothetical protein
LADDALQWQCQRKAAEMERCPIERQGDAGARQGLIRKAEGGNLSSAAYMHLFEAAAGVADRHASPLALPASAWRVATLQFQKMHMHAMSMTAASWSPATRRTTAKALTRLVLV